MDVMSRHTSASRDFVAGRERSERREFTLRQLRDWALKEWTDGNEMNRGNDGNEMTEWTDGNEMNRGNDGESGERSKQRWTVETKWTHYLNIINKTKIRCEASLFHN